MNDHAKWSPPGLVQLPYSIASSVSEPGDLGSLCKPCTTCGCCWPYFSPTRILDLI